GFREQDEEYNKLEKKRIERHRKRFSQTPDFFLPRGLMSFLDQKIAEVRKKQKKVNVRKKQKASRKKNRK
ncbi:MAG: hypothetical protein SFU25_02135, partial [Candidatus Caenarcaniphilales bacterium]|nr:hypothetical protein [Candidatus Caenarcaniphilales bacterium]